MANGNFTVMVPIGTSPHHRTISFLLNAVAAARRAAGGPNFHLVMQTSAINFVFADEAAAQIFEAEFQPASSTDAAA